MHNTNISKRETIPNFRTANNRVFLLWRFSGGESSKKLIHKNHKKNMDLNESNNSANASETIC